MFVEEKQQLTEQQLTTYLKEWQDIKKDVTNNNFESMVKKVKELGGDYLQIKESTVELNIVQCDLQIVETENRILQKKFEKEENNNNNI